MMGSDNGDWLKKYHAEHASYGGASHEFHARAQTWVATRDAEIARLKARLLVAEAAFDRGMSAVITRDAEIARLKGEVARLTEVARLLVGECEEQRECPVCGTDTNVEVCRPSCYVAKMRKLLADLDALLGKGKP